MHQMASKSIKKRHIELQNGDCVHDYGVESCAKCEPTTSVGRKSLVLDKRRKMAEASLSYITTQDTILKLQISLAESKSDFDTARAECAIAAGKLTDAERSELERLLDIVLPRLKATGSAAAASSTSSLNTPG